MANSTSVKAPQAPNPPPALDPLKAALEKLLNFSKQHNLGEELTTLIIDANREFDARE